MLRSNVAIQAGNVLKKPVLVFFGLTPKAHHANLRHYTFLLQGLHDVTLELTETERRFCAAAAILSTAF